MYQIFGKDVFEHHITDKGYNSIHYLLWYDGKYVEIQVRSIYDEVWGECTHDLVYEYKNKAPKVELERLSVCLATQTQAAGMIADLMFEKSERGKVTEGGEAEEVPVHTEQDKRYAGLEKRIRSMNENPNPPAMLGRIE